MQPNSENITTGICVFDKQEVKVFQLSNGKFQGHVTYKTMHFETQEADTLSEARQFAYFILHEASQEY